MNPPDRPPPGIAERRRHGRRVADNVRVRLVSGEFDDSAGSTNFARRLVNFSQAGACVESTGRLRPDVNMTIELRFEAFGGSLRSRAHIVWAESRKEGAAEVHYLGVKFVGPELTNAVRDFLEGDRASIIVARRSAEYEELKEKSNARKKERTRKKWSATKKSVVFALLLILIYVGSFGVFVWTGRTNPGQPGIRFQYARGGAAEETLATIYSPLVRIVRSAGVDLAHDAAGAPKP